jgi:Na+-transporting NADH:ubiquinone oxidoreductase subunit F
MVLVRKIHKWASVLIGIQLLLWLSSGIFFNMMDSKKAHGNLYRGHVNQKMNIKADRLVDPAQVLKKAEEATSLKLVTLLTQPYYLLNYRNSLYANFKQEQSLVHAYSGEYVLIDDVMANQLAHLSYTGSAQIKSTQLLQPPLEDIGKEKNAAWQINFADEENTSVYIQASSGRLIGHVDDHKRFADFFFMLHFMDYGNEGSFNTIQMTLFAFVTLWLSLTGLIWTIDLGLKGQYKVKRKTKRSKRLSAVKPSV